MQLQHHRIFNDGWLRLDNESVVDILSMTTVETVM